MDKLSSLLREARPLYKQRKRNRAIAKVVLSVTLPVFMMASLCQVCLQGDDLYLSLSNDDLQTRLLEDDFGLYR